MSQESSKTYGDQAHLLRAIEHAITYDRMAAPRAVDMLPEYGHALIRFADDDAAAVKEWAALAGATVVHGTTTYDTDRPWHEFGTRPGGKKGALVGWRVDLWCSVNSPSPRPKPELSEAELVDEVDRAWVEAESNAQAGA